MAGPNSGGHADQVSAVGRYEILREIGRGGMAIVYLARQRDLDRHVALKELSSFHAGSEEFAQRFVRESRLAGSLNHPNIVTVHEYFEHEGTQYIAMEYVPRGSLRRYIKRLSLGQACGVLEGVLAGLAHAETAGIVHRDLKPENIMVTADGRVKITDFGIARATVSTGFRTETGMTVGTPAYMAPEQAAGSDLGPWTDLYSVGVMAYEFVVGDVPFHDTSAPMAVMMRHMSEPIPAAAQVRPEVDPALSDWIDSLLVKDPNRRVAHAHEAWEALEDIAVQLLGPMWRRNARLLDDQVAAREAAPLTPAPFESGGRIATPPSERVASVEPAASSAPPEVSPPEPAEDVAADAPEPAEATLGGAGVLASSPSADAGFVTFKPDVPAGTPPLVDLQPVVAPEHQQAVLTPPGSEPVVTPPEPEPVATPAEPEPVVTPAESEPVATPKVADRGYETVAGEEKLGYEAAPDVASVPDEAPADKSVPEPPVVEPPVAEPALTAEPMPVAEPWAASDAAPVAAAEHEEVPARVSRPRGPVIAGATAAVVAAAALGFVLAPRPSAKPSGPAPLRQSASAGALTVHYPVGWRRGTRPPAEATALDLSSPVTLTPAGSRSGGALVLGTAKSVNAALVSPQFASRLSGPPQGEPVKLKPDGYVFRRYLYLEPRGATSGESLYVLPTTAGTVTAACVAPASGAAGFTVTCERAVGSLQVRGTVLPLGPDPAFASRLTSAVRTLDSARTKLGARLAGAKTPAAQASAARSLANAYHSAAAAAAEAKPNPSASLGATALVHGLRRLEADYAGLSAAAAHNRASSYNSAKRAIDKDEASVAAAFGAVKQAGYALR